MSEKFTATPTLEDPSAASRRSVEAPTIDSSELANPVRERRVAKMARAVNKLFGRQIFGRRAETVAESRANTGVGMYGLTGEQIGYVDAATRDGESSLLRFGWGPQTLDDPHAVKGGNDMDLNRRRWKAAASVYGEEAMASGWVAATKAAKKEYADTMGGLADPDWYPSNADIAKKLPKELRDVYGLTA